MKIACSLLLMSAVMSHTSCCNTMNAAVARTMCCKDKCCKEQCIGDKCPCGDCPSLNKVKAATMLLPI